MAAVKRLRYLFDRVTGERVERDVLYCAECQCPTFVASADHGSVQLQLQCANCLKPIDDTARWLVPRSKVIGEGGAT